MDRVRDVILSAFPLSAEHVYDLGASTLRHCISGHGLLPLVMSRRRPVTNDDYDLTVPTATTKSQAQHLSGERLVRNSRPPVDLPRINGS